MAEKTTKAPATSAGNKAPNTSKQDAMKVARDARDSAAKNDRFVHVGKVAEGTKTLAPQAQTIVNAIQAAGKGGITRSDLVKSLDGVLTTRQPVGRIVSYYQKLITETGHVEIRPATGVAKEA
jgi:hypothetical protein